MVDSRDKGARAEAAAKKEFRKYTGLGWERTPSSGALGEQHLLKGDLYVPGEKNLYTIEVKHFKDCQINHLMLSGKNPMILEWWEQAEREARQNGNTPLLVFKHDRSKWFIATDIPEIKCNYLTYKYDPTKHALQISLLDSWLLIERDYIK